MIRSTTLAAATLLALTAGAAIAAPTRLGTEGAYQPYNYVDDNGNVGGYDIDVGNEVCERAGLECTWVVNEWDSLIPNLIAGNYDAILADMFVIPERTEKIDFTQIYFPPDPSTFLALASRSFDFANLKGLRIGAQSATVQTTYLEEHLKADNTILSFATQDQELADLRAGNIDLVLIEGSVAGETVAGSKGELKVDGPELALGNGVGIGIRKTDTALKDKFDAALASMKADGWLDALILKYFPEKKGGPFFPN
jgi:polar amino acid transport system substrate-binding protein